MGGGCVGSFGGTVYWTTALRYRKVQCVGSSPEVHTYSGWAAAPEVLWMDDSPEVHKYSGWAATPRHGGCVGSYGDALLRATPCSKRGCCYQRFGGWSVGAVLGRQAGQPAVTYFSSDAHSGCPEVWCVVLYSE